MADHSEGENMVGASRFERPTSRTPSECATGLRYAPNHWVFSSVWSAAFHYTYRES